MKGRKVNAKNSNNEQESYFMYVKGKHPSG